jgi:hypothetical protein
MIGYKISLNDLQSLIEAESPGWLAAAKKKTAEFRNDGCYNEKKGTWSKIKPVLMRIQGGSKCAYCERKLESEDYGKGEQDVEHFRPKKNIRAWKPSKALENEGVKVTKPKPDSGGYHLLAYHPFNYCAACKPCNSALKSDCFPIAGKYRTKGADPVKLAKEFPLLIYPIGDFDGNPESLIRFHGISPQAVASSGHDRHRALTTIEFFKLDDIMRKNLIAERARLICALLPLCKAASKNGPSAIKAKKLLIAYTEDTTPHANCARSFVKLFQSDAQEACDVESKAAQFITGIS